MPAKHRFGSDHQEKPSPVVPKPALQHLEELVKRAEFWSGLPKLQYRALLAKARFSRSSLRRERKQRATSPKLSRAKLNMYHSHSKSWD
jgi:hypothetical protein